MTQTLDMDTMEAGREMDALIAERVMGWTWRAWIGAEGTMRSLEPPENYDDSEDGPGDTWPADMTEPVFVPDIHDLPHYSTDIAAAWEVVEHMAREDQWSPHHANSGFLTLTACGMVLYAASFLYDCDLHEGWWDRADQLPASAGPCAAPLAICRAALKATAPQEA